MDDSVSESFIDQSITEKAINEAHLIEYGDLLVEYLHMLGVEYVFGIPGGAVEPLVNALARSERAGGPKCIVTRHESGAAFMADGYHNSTGKLGVCFGTTGPGTTNLVTGVASAYANNIPLLVITAQTALNTFGKNALQESSCTGTNTLSIFESITRYNSLVSHPDQLEHKLAAALMAACRTPKGPSHLTIPLDVLKSKVPKNIAYRHLAGLVADARLFDALAYEKLVPRLFSCTNPVFVIGNEARAAIPAILEVAEWLNIPMVVTPHGKGLINPYHPLFRGVIGFAGHETSLETLRDPAVDIVVAIGSSLGEWASNGWDAAALLNDRLVHVGLSDRHFTGSPMASLHVKSCPTMVFEKILADIKQAPIPRRIPKTNVVAQSPQKYFHFKLDNEAACLSDQVPLLPQRLMTELPKLFPPTTRYLADSGNSFVWAVHYLHTDQETFRSTPNSGSSFYASLDFASMGWAIASAVGTAFGLPDCPVVCITGDGSYLMAGQEITVALANELTVIYIILNDAGYGMVKHGQRLTGGERASYQLPKINYAAMAEAMGIPGHVVESVDDLHQLDIGAICNRKGPTLLDVRIDSEACPPMSLRTRVLRGDRP